MLYNYPAELAAPGRAAALPPHTYLGGSLRDEPADAEVDAWLSGDDEPFVYVSFGSFLSVRGDVLRRVTEALRASGVRAAVATGSTPPTDLGSLPPDWLVREYLPQVRLLRRARVLVTHGGNNSVTEAVATATPLLVLPFSTDQFAGAAAVERTGVGEALDPNAASVADLQAAIDRLLHHSGAGASTLTSAARALDAEPGPVRAYRAVLASASPASAIS